jgi:hypothetical protein
MRTILVLRPAILVAALLLAAAPHAAHAQVWVGASGPRPGSTEIAVGGGFNLGASSDPLSAELTPNPSSGQGSFDLFESESKLRSAPAAQAYVAVYVTRALAIEGGFQFARPVLEVELTDDFEDAPNATATTTITQYLFTGSLVYHFGRAGGSVTPFVAGGAGYVRDVHSGNGLIETGVEYHGKAGVKLWFGRRQKNGLRLEGGVSIRDGGFTLDEDRRIVPNAGASFAYRF